MIPAVEGYDPGDPVNHSDFINLYSDPDGFVGTSTRNLNPVKTLFPPLPEVFIGPRGGGFSIKLYKEVKNSKILSQVSETSLTMNSILGSDLVQFYNKDLNSFLTADEDNSLILKKSPAGEGRVVGSLANSFWVVENIKSKYSSPIQISSGSGTSQDITLVNFVTGRKAVFPSGLDHTSLKSLIRITTLDIKSGDCIKMYSGKAWLGFGDLDAEDHRKIICTDHRDHTDVFTVHKIDINTKQRMFKLLGFKLLLTVIEQRCVEEELTMAHLNDVVSAIKEMHWYISNVKKKVELYNNCLALGITRLCFNICNMLIPRMQEGPAFTTNVEWMVILIRGMMKHTGELLDDQGLDLTRNLLVSLFAPSQSYYRTILRKCVY